MSCMLLHYHLEHTTNEHRYYIPTVLHSNVGLSKDLSQVIGGCVQIMFAVGSAVPTILADRIGRRRPMIWGVIGMGLCMMMVSILLSFRGQSNEHSTASAAIAFFFLYMLVDGASVNCIPWCYVPEILPLHARSKGTAIGVSSNWIWVCYTRIDCMTWVYFANWILELLRCYDHPCHHQPPAMEGVFDIHVH